MKRRAGHLDNRNLGSRATIELDDGVVFHGIIASIQHTLGDVENGVPGKVRVMFTDNDTTLTLGRQHTVDLHLSGTELSIMSIDRMLRERLGIAEQDSGLGVHASDREGTNSLADTVDW